jgi:hypothetical protein
MVLASAISAPLSASTHGSLKFRIPNSILKFKMAPRSASRRRAAPDTEGLKVAQEVAHEVEEKLRLVFIFERFSGRKRRRWLNHFFLFKYTTAE